jgi:hypothetical protein
MSTHRPGGPLPPRGYSDLTTVTLFALGALVTAVFSGSLARLTSAGPVEVLVMGMIVPSFTWLVQLAASGLRMSAADRRLYWCDLGLLGSVALLQAGVLNLVADGIPIWLSAANVLVSVGVMAADLFRRSKRHGISVGWPVSWCATIVLNMSLFLFSSRGWWSE